MSPETFSSQISSEVMSMVVSFATTAGQSVKCTPGTYAYFTHSPAGTITFAASASNVQLLSVQPSAPHPHGGLLGTSMEQVLHASLQVQFLSKLKFLLPTTLLPPLLSKNAASAMTNFYKTC